MGGEGFSPAANPPWMISSCLRKKQDLNPSLRPGGGAGAGVCCHPLWCFANSGKMGARSATSFIPLHRYVFSTHFLKFSAQVVSSQISRSGQVAIPPKILVIAPLLQLLTIARFPYFANFASIGGGGATPLAFRN